MITQEKIEPSIKLGKEPRTDRPERRSGDTPAQPAIPGLRFRPFRGKADYPAMAAVIDGSKEADSLEWVTSSEEIARSYRHLVNCDPERDMLFVEVDGQVVGYSRVWWTQERTGSRLYQQFAHLLPEWRDTGIRRAMVQRNMDRLRQIALDHPADGPRYFEAWANDSEAHWESLLLDLGFDAVRWGFEMVRPDLADIPDHPLPVGLEVRPVQSEHYEPIRQALNEAFLDHWGGIEFREEWLAEWAESPTFRPELWQVAWAGDRIAGTVLSFINAKENEEYGRQRGWTEYICTLRPWRRQGLAKALISRSLRLLKAEGMAEAALGVDTQNLCGALDLYQGLGFRPAKRGTTYRRPLA